LSSSGDGKAKHATGASPLAAGKATAH